MTDTGTGHVVLKREEPPPKRVGRKPGTRPAGTLKYMNDRVLNRLDKAPGVWHRYGEQHFDSVRASIVIWCKAHPEYEVTTRAGSGPGWFRIWVRRKVESDG